MTGKQTESYPISDALILVNWCIDDASVSETDCS
jgi:hypothetical protein